MRRRHVVLANCSPSAHVGSPKRRAFPLRLLISSRKRPGPAFRFAVFIQRGFLIQPLQSAAANLYDRLRGSTALHRESPGSRSARAACGSVEFMGCRAPLSFFEGRTKPMLVLRERELCLLSGGGVKKPSLFR